MNHLDLNLRDLTYVLAIARHESFSLAAQECLVSQPALSKQIKNLETQLNLKLFERNKRHVRLTEAGKQFILQANIVLDEARKLLQLFTNQTAVLSGPLQLGAIASSCPYLLPLFVGPLRTEFPQLELIVKEGLTDDLIKALKQGSLDTVIAAETFEDDALEHIHLFFEPFLLASRRDDLPRQSENISVEDIDTRRLLLLEDGHCLKNQTMELCSLKNQDMGLNFKATSLETLLQMSAAGMGVAVIPALAKPRSSRLNDSLLFSRFENPTIGRRMAIFYRKTYPLKDQMRILTQFIIQHLPDTVHAFKEPVDESV